MKAGRHVEKMVRADPIYYIIEDRWTDVSSVYIGMTPLFTTLTSEPLWLIERQTFDGTKIVTEFANVGKWNCIWDNRASYFGAPGGSPFPAMTVSGSFTATLSGLNIAGRLTEVALNAVTWTALPAAPLANRNAMGIQNQSGTEIKLNYSNTEPLYKGVIVGAGSERYYDIKDTITVYAKAAAGTPTVLIEEIS